MDRLKTLGLACGLAWPADRAAAAALLARHFGADSLMLFVRDPELNAFLPAPGLPQTLPGGPGWLELLRRCQSPGTHAGEVAFPDRTSACAAVALSTEDGLVFVLLGGRPRLDDLETLCLPLLAATFRNEVAAAAARGRESSAREAARHATTLTAVLDATRAHLESSLAETRRLNAELQQADRAKDEFLAMLAHELRNPLSPIVSALEWLRRQGPDAPVPARTLEVMDRQTRHLARLVDDLLDVSRISRGRITLRREPTPLGGALLQAVDAVRPLIDRQAHTLALSLPESPLFVMADPHRLTQVFANLLTNAAKYTPPGGRIDVEARQEDEQAAVRVRDNGIGIEKDMLPRVFDLFVQAPRALDRSSGGLGIGLTLVWRLIGLHGGSIEASSEGSGKGSEFVVRLAITEQRPQAAVARQPAEPVRRRILVVEDNVDSAEMLADMLRLGGFSVTVAGDGEAGLAAALESSPEVVLLDLGLPKMDGYAVARQLREKLPGTRLVALSGYGDEEHRRRSGEAGFDAHLVKPVELDELLAMFDPEKVQFPAA